MDMSEAQAVTTQQPDTMLTQERLLQIAETGCAPPDHPIYYYSNSQGRLYRLPESEQELQQLDAAWEHRHIAEGAAEYMERHNQQARWAVGPLIAGHEELVRLAFHILQDPPPTLYIPKGVRIVYDTSPNRRQYTGRAQRVQLHRPAVPMFIAHEQIEKPQIGRAHV